MVSAKSLHQMSPCVRSASLPGLLARVTFQASRSRVQFDDAFAPGLALVHPELEAVFAVIVVHVEGVARPVLRKRLGLLQQRIGRGRKGQGEQYWACEDGAVQGRLREFGRAGF